MEWIAIAWLLLSYLKDTFIIEKKNIELAGRLGRQEKKAQEDS